MFSEDLCSISGLSQAREELMDQKGRILENIVEDFKDALLGERTTTLLSLIDFCDIVVVFSFARMHQG